MPAGPAAEYLAKYNGYTLPGYVQNESFDSTVATASHVAPYADGSETEITGLQNKNISLRLKVWENDYLSCKQQTRQAATMLRSSKGFAPLYIQENDKHYDAIVTSIREDKEAGTLIKTLEYQVDFECKPWLISDTITTISGTSLIDTDVVSRTIDNGGWSPTTITVTGTNVTISGYTSSGDFTGFVSISGSVTDMVLDSEAFTATIGGVNSNEYVNFSDYRIYVGPEKTYFNITGADECTISWYDRWYL